MKISVVVTALYVSLSLVFEGKVSAREYSTKKSREIRIGVRGRRTEDYQGLWQKRRLQDRPCMAGMMETCAPSSAPSEVPSEAPSTSHSPTFSPAPSQSPSQSPAPSFEPTLTPSGTPTSSLAPSPAPSSAPSEAPIIAPSLEPTSVRSASPSGRPSGRPTSSPSSSPSLPPTSAPSSRPSLAPTRSAAPSSSPTFSPAPTASAPPSGQPSSPPSSSPSTSIAPSSSPSKFPTVAPSNSAAPSVDPFGYDTRISVDANGDLGVTSTCRQDPPADTTPVNEQLVGFDYILNVESGADLSLIIPSLTSQIHDEVVEDYLDCQYEEGAAPFYVYEQSSLPQATPNSSGCTAGNQDIGSDCYLINAGFTSYIFTFPENRRLLSGNITDRDVLKSFSQSLENIFASGSLGGPNVVSIQYLGISNDAVPEKPKEKIAGKVVGGIIGGLCLIALIVAAVMLGNRRERQHSQYRKQLKAIENIDAAIESDDGSQNGNPGDGKPFVVFNDDESYGSGFQIMPGANKKQVPQEPTYFVATDDMLSTLQDDLGPSAYAAQTSPRRYEAENTVDL